MITVSIIYLLRRLSLSLTYHYLYASAFPLIISFCVLSNIAVPVRYGRPRCHVSFSYLYIDEEVPIYIYTPYLPYVPACLPTCLPASNSSNLYMLLLCYCDIHTPLTSSKYGVQKIDIHLTFVEVLHWHRGCTLYVHSLSKQRN